MLGAAVSGRAAMLLSPKQGSLIAPETRKCCGVPAHAVTRANRFGRGCVLRVMVPCLPRRERADEDRVALDSAYRPTARLMALPQRRRSRSAEQRNPTAGRASVVPELQHPRHPGGAGGVAGDATGRSSGPRWKPRGNMLEEAAHELVAAETAGSRSAGLAFLAMDGDCFVVEADDAGTRERYERRSGRGHRAPACSPSPQAVTWRIQRLLHTASGMTIGTPGAGGPGICRAPICREP